MKLLQFIFLIIRRGSLFMKPVDFECKRREIISSFYSPPDDVPLKHPRLWRVPGLYAIMSAFSFFRDRHTMNNMFYVSESNRVVFARILKAAGTSVLTEFLGLIDNKLKNRSMTDEQVDAVAYYFTKREIPSSAIAYDRFAIVRDPYQRIVSVYLDLFDPASPVFTYEAYWFGILDRNMSFKDFIKVISKVPASLLGPHFCPQSIILKEGLHAKIFRLEKDREELTGFLGGLGIELSHRNKQKEAYDYRTYYDKETFGLVNAIYTADITRFDYTSEQELLRKFLNL